MTTLLLFPIKEHTVPFSHIPIGGLFVFRDRFYTRTSSVDGRPVVRRQHDPATTVLVGEVVHEVHCSDEDRFFITEILERGRDGGAVVNRMPVSAWPIWSMALQRQLFPTPPRSVIQGPCALAPRRFWRKLVAWLTRGEA